MAGTLGVASIENGNVAGQVYFGIQHPTRGSAPGHPVQFV